MLTQAENERLTRVGPGTPAGNLMRRYWHPVAAQAQLLERGVMPVRMFGEDLVLFRDGNGRPGLVADRCAHRSVKLEHGFCTTAGLTCPYHGWTYDVNGNCVQQPGEPAGSTFKEKVTITAYPVQELAGLLFAYLGPLPAPLLPRWDRLVWDNVYRVIGFVKIPCNWLQCMENTPDPVHTEYLHGHYFKHLLDKSGSSDDRSRNLAAGFSTHFLKHEYAVGKYGVDRRWLLEGQSLEKDTWAKAQPLVFPDIHCTSGGGRHTFGWRMPIDDENTLEVYVRGFDPGPGVEVPEQHPVPYLEVEMVDEEGRFTALNSVTGQDVMAWVSQGTIVDRTQERLGDTDRGVIMFRQMLKAQIDIVEAGGDPINTFRSAADNQCIDLPVPWDRGYAWGYGKDGSYVRGSITAADPLPDHLKNEIEDLFVRASESRQRPASAIA